VNADGRVHIDELHGIWWSPRDLNGDGGVDVADVRSVEGVVRGSEQQNMATGQP